MADIEIGVGKSARRGFELRDVTVVPSRRTRDSGDIELSWQLDAFRFDLPLMASAMDSVVSPASAAEIGALGGLAVLDLEGLWTRYEDPDPLLDEIAALAADRVTRRLQEIYAAPVRPELVSARVAELSRSGAVTCGAISPKHAATLGPVAVAAELDILVIQGLVVSAEHVTKGQEPLNLKRFIRELDVPVVVGGCASYQAALHLMRTGAVGILVGVGAGSASTNGNVLGIGIPHATAIADAAGARTRHLEETGVYVQVIANGGMATGGDLARAVACGADAVMLGAPLAAATNAPGRGWHWGAGAGHASLPRGSRVPSPPRGSLAEFLLGPAHADDGRTNLFGGLRHAMATCGYATVRELHKAEVVVARCDDRA